MDFIISMFYGANKNKNGKEISNYDKYKPFCEGEYSGKISYELDGEDEESYEVYRNFTKKNPIIFDKNANDISKEFEISKADGNKFFYEQTKVDEELFNMVMVIHQSEVVLDSKEKNTLIQKVSNIMLTGEDSVSYKNVWGKLDKIQKDDIGTLKSPTKPLYQEMQKKEELISRKREIEEIRDDKFKIEEEIKNKKIELSQEEELLKALREMIDVEQVSKNEQEKIKININTKNELEENKTELQNELDKIEIEDQKAKSYKLLYFIPIFATIISTALFLSKNITYALAGYVISAILFIAIIMKNLSEKQKYKKIQDEKRKQKRNLEAKIEIIEEEIKSKEKNIKDIKENITQKMQLKKEEIRLKYPDISKSIFNSVQNGLNLSKEQDYINELKLDISKREFEKEQITEKLEQLVEIEEKLNQAQEKLEELIEYNEEIEIAKQALEEAYYKMKDSITPKFTQNLSKAISSITDGKYKTVKVNEENDLALEIENRKLYRCKKSKSRYYG